MFGTAVPCELPHQEVCMYIPIAMVFLPFDSSCEHKYKRFEYEYIVPEQNNAGSEWRLSSCKPWSMHEQAACCLQDPALGSAFS